MGKRGRKPIPLDLAKVEKCGELMMSQADAAMLLGIHRRTFEERLKDHDGEVRKAWELGQAKARCALRAAQWKLALGGEYKIPGTDKTIVIKPSVTMLIWLGKQYLGQSDKPTPALVSDGVPFERFTVNITHPKGRRASAKTGGSSDQAKSEASRPASFRSGA